MNSMKRLLLFLCVSVLLLGCNPDGPLTDTQVMNKYVDSWIYQNMSQLYYWNTTLPAASNSHDNPAEYFKTLKYKDDRFSAIFESYQDILNQLNGVSAAEIGFEFQLYFESKNNNNVLGEVSYVKWGTPAAAMGIKRGDIFRKINGQQITTANYSTVVNYMFDNSASSSITFSTLQNGFFTDKAAVTVTKAVNYQEDPVYMDTVYIVNGKKVGYLVYNFFSNDIGDESLKYDLELNTVFGQFKQQNISELILDLRYNHGGKISSAVHLSSMLVPSVSADKIFTYTEYNQILTEYFNSNEYKSKYNDNPFVTNFVTSIDVTVPATASYPIQNIGNNLHRIFFLTGSGTASASEMVINGLKPFFPCVLIGDTTVGKNVGSTLVYDDQNTKNHWAFMPIIMKVYNCDHKSDFSNGFVPDYRIEDDYSYLLGDTREGLLSKAISQISGLSASPAKSAPVKRELFRSSINFKPLRNALIIKNKSIDSYLNQNKKL